jgi:hypothetical protein
MSDLQWLWCYFNILEDEKEDELKWKSRLDYLGWWVNPQLAKSVMEAEKRQENKNKSSFSDEPEPYDPSREIVEGDTAFSSTFEDELKQALAEAGIEENFTELPDSQNVGDSNESKDDFISRVMAAQSTFNINENETIFDEVPEKSLEQTVEELGLNMDDIDFFEFPD